MTVQLLKLNAVVGVMGKVADLLEVVNRYNNDPRFSLGLTNRQKADLVEFLKSL